MSRVYYNKLVRDKIKDIIETKGESCEVRTIETDEEFQQELMKKIIEEAKALAMTRSKEEYIGELTDLILVIDTLNEFLGLTEEDIETAMQANYEAKGKYEKRYFLHWSDDKTYESNESPQGIRMQESE